MAVDSACFFQGTNFSQIKHTKSVFWSQSNLKIGAFCKNR